jgi:small subunit ribosomal protein S14
MAKKSIIARNVKRERKAAKHLQLRQKLKAIIHDSNSDFEQIIEAQQGLQALPRDSSRTRLRNRCAITGRGRGNYRKFGLSRNKLRELAMKGEVPGLVKSSW